MRRRLSHHMFLLARYQIPYLSVHINLIKSGQQGQKEETLKTKEFITVKSSKQI